ncbi:hypothetical protein JTE90_029666 [Oedothorax gibbosus]|uniref:FERM domain-containing protein n=1 Tax=Oedothorax gibbosus TaxID=931172 RepID=A0AAV6VEF9_9ARAC|nr:hypothetical protein JTE90_029666 [Oedothorax gibbosus]
MGCFRRKKKTHQCIVVLLDETEIIEEIQCNTRGETLLEKVYAHLNLLEKAYFGLRYLNRAGESRWLDPLSKILKQFKGLTSLKLYFGVKFYASDPCKLLEEITRYQFVLQLKQDILHGRLPLSTDLAVELFALSLQAELGDYDPRKHQPQYVSEFRFYPDQTPQMEDRVEQRHKTLIGQVPATVEMTFLERVKWLDMYGVDLHRVMGDDHVEYFVGLTPSGVVVMRGKKTTSHYFWPRISKVFFKGKYFMLRVRDKAKDETTFGFLLSSRESCEYLWRCCVEHHAFFRLTQVRDVPGNSLHIFRLGSKYRYSGRTEQQLKNDIRHVRRPPPPIVRVPSRRFQKRTGQPDGADADVQEKEIFKKSFLYNTKDDMAVPHVTTISPLYRSVSTPAIGVLTAALAEPTTDLPPWEDPNQKGLFSSRTSLNSHQSVERRRKRSSSIDSHTSNDSRRRRHHHSSRKSSDNESEISKSSKDTSRSSHRRARRSGSDSDSHHSHHQHRSRRRKHSRRSNGHLVDSETQWKMIQQAEKNAGYQSAVVRDLTSRRSGYMNSGADTESEAPTRHKKKHRRHSRSRSRSPEVLSHEVKKHLEYKLVDPAHLTEEEKRDIKYTKVESESVFRIRYSPSSGRPHRYKVDSSRNSVESRGRRSGFEDELPPYTAGNVKSSTKKILTSNGKSNVQRIENAGPSNYSKRNPDSMKPHHVKSQADPRRKKSDTRYPQRRDVSTEL